MRHKSGREMSPTAVEYSARHNLCRIGSFSTGRFICKPKPLGTDSFSFRNAIITLKINNKSTFIARFRARKVVFSSRCIVYLFGYTMLRALCTQIGLNKTSHLGQFGYTKYACNRETFFCIQLPTKKA